MIRDQRDTKYYNNLYSNTWKADYENQPSRNMRYHFTLGEFAKILTKNPNSDNAKILDYGCWNGYLLNIIKNKFNIQDSNLYWFDISSSAVSIGREKYKFTLYDNLTELRELKFDVILLIDVIEHIEDDQGLLESLYDLLNEWGSLLISTSLYNFYWTKSDDIWGHVRRYTKWELVTKSRKAKFNIENIFTYWFPFGTIYMLLKGIFVWDSPESETKMKDKYWNSFIIGILKKLFIFNIPILWNQVIVNLNK